MSGGSLDYGQFKIDEIRGMIEARATGNSLHLAFAQHLGLVGEAVHELEWLYSGDTVEGDEVEAIEKVLMAKESQIKLKYYLEEGKAVIEQLQELMKK